MMSMWNFDPSMGTKFVWNNYEVAVQAEANDAAGMGFQDVIIIYRKVGATDWVMFDTVWHSLGPSGAQSFEDEVGKFGSFGAFMNWFIAALNQKLAAFVTKFAPVGPVVGEPKNITEFGAWIAGGGITFTISPTQIVAARK